MLSRLSSHTAQKSAQLLANSSASEGVYLANLRKSNSLTFKAQATLAQFRGELCEHSQQAWKIKLGTRIKTHNGEKTVIGFTGQGVKNLDPQKELFYGEAPVALSFKARAKTNGDKHPAIWVLGANHKPTCKDHGEAWFEGSFRPLSPEGQKNIGLVAIRIDQLLKDPESIQ